MKRSLLLSVTAALMLAGCGDNSSGPGAGTNSTGGSLVTAPVDYLNEAGKAQQRAVGTVDITALNQAVQLFYTDKGRFPKDLNELVDGKFIPRIPDPPHGNRFDYDAATGTVKLVKQ